MPEHNSDATAQLIAENKRLRRLVEIIHDSVCPADSERFPKLGEEVCRVFFMNGFQQDHYWYLEACRALGVKAHQLSVSERNTVVKPVLQIGTAHSRLL